MAYADYNDLMDLTEDLVNKLVFEVTGGTVIKIHPKGAEDPEVIEIDFKKPWKRVSMMEELAKIL